ncbi:MAG: BatD family protein [Polyangiaceae bacterium]|nr:BatD family protein [Polyangiaceae bacterium]
MPKLALAQRLNTELSARQVEVGETFVVQLTTLVDDDSAQPQNPSLKLPPGFVALGPNVSTQQQISIVNGRMSRNYGVTASWSVTPTKAGRYTIGPASIVVQGRRLSDDAQTLEVLPQGALPRQPSQPQARGGFPQGFDPFDPFGPGGPFGGRLGRPSLPDPSLDEPAFDPASVPDEWRVAKALDPLAFIVSKASPKKVVVGQALTLKVFAYSSYPAFDDVSVTDVTRKEFLAYDLTRKDQVSVRRVPIGDQLFGAAQIRELMLVPLSVGHFKVGELTMELALISRSGQKVVKRTSVPADVEVVEPPMKGRPVGYRLGDVGHFQLKVEVAPREVEAGGAVAITAWLEGQGNFPGSLSIPEQNGVEFSQPTINEEIAPKDGALTGYRKFTYVARLSKVGSVDLGNLELPYFNPSAGYETASAALGRVNVIPANAPRTGQVEAKPPLPQAPPPLEHILQLMQPRQAILSATAKAPELSDRTWFFPLLLLGPVLVVFGQTLTKACKALWVRGQARKNALSYRAQQALKEAQGIAQSGSLDAVAPLERAIVGVLEDKTGVKARGVLRHELVKTLTAGGLSHELAKGAEELLERCDNVRFSASSSREVAELVTDAASWVARVQSFRRKGG